MSPIDNPAKMTYIINATGGGGNGLRPGIASSAEPDSVYQGRVIFLSPRCFTADYPPQFIKRPRK